MNKILSGDSLEILKTFADNSVDSVVTDPPYGLGEEPDIVEVMRDWVNQGYHEVKSKKGFMGKAWDAFVPQPILWREVFRVLKPGGHILVACGTRTQDWMTASLRFAGFEVRDVIAWLYGSGFPKSLDISKAIDKAAGAEREVVGTTITKDIRRNVAADLEAGITHREGKFAAGAPTTYMEHKITAPATDAAKAWDGWGTALKPAMELWTLARKPLSENTVAANVLKWGTGGLNIDGCRVETTDVLPKMSGTSILGGTGDGWDRPWKNDPEGLARRQKAADAAIEKANTLGRFPANLIHDGSTEVVGLFPDTKSGASAEHHTRHTVGGNGNTHGKMAGAVGPIRQASEGSAARFFYCAKASKSERGEGNTHPTVKPVALMRYLVKLITPEWGTVLDPFAGSGTTGEACMLEDYNSILIEREAEYIPIIENRLKKAAK